VDGAVEPVEVGGTAQLEDTHLLIRRARGTTCSGNFPSITGADPGHRRAAGPIGWHRPLRGCGKFGMMSGDGSAHGAHRGV